MHILIFNIKRLSFIFTLLAISSSSAFSQSVKWDVSLWGKPSAFTAHVEKLSELVAQKTNGDFQLNISYGDLSLPRQNLDGIAAGKFEMAQFCAGYHAHKNPAITVLELPYLGIRTLSQERTVSQFLYRHPAVVKDFARWNAVPLMPSPLPQFNLIGTSATPRSLEDLSGMNIRAVGNISESILALNAQPVSLPTSQLESALAAGEVDAVALAPHAHMSHSTIKSARWWTTNLDPGTINCPVVANTNAVVALSSEHRNALYGSINEALDHYIANYEYNIANAWQPLLSTLEIERVDFDEQQLKKFKHEVGLEAAVAWIEEMEEIGLPAVDLYRFVKIALSGENPEAFVEEEGFIAARTGALPQTAVATNPQTTTATTTQTTVATENTLLNKRLNAVISAHSFDKSPSNKIERIGQIGGQIEELPQRVQNNQTENAQLQEAAFTSEPATTTAATAATSDPFKMTIGWEHDNDTTVGAAISEIANFIDYQLIVSNDTAAELYSRRLPAVQQRVDAITIDEAINALAGRGFMTILDHSARTISHLAVETGL